MVINEIKAKQLYINSLYFDKTIMNMKIFCKIHPKFECMRFSEINCKQWANKNDRIAKYIINTRAYQIINY